jgi:hypothetical protein
MTRYLSGLCVAGLGLCGGGWLVVAAVAFGGESAGLAGDVNLLTGAGLIALSALSLVCWSVAWRQRMRVDGVLADRFLAVSKRDARRNRRALGRDVRRAGKLAERSARGARRTARRSARAGGGGVHSGGVHTGGELSEGGVRSAGVGFAGMSPADDPGNLAVSYGVGANGLNGRNGKGIGATGSGGTGGNGEGAPGPAVAGVNGSTGDAAELIGQLREMLVPLLTATGSQPALGDQAGSVASWLPQRTPSASAFRPRATVPMPRVETVPTPVWQPPARQRPVPRLAVPAVDDNGLGSPVDSEEAWW